MDLCHVDLYILSVKIRLSKNLILQTIYFFMTLGFFYYHEKFGISPFLFSKIVFFSLFLKASKKVLKTFKRIFISDETWMK